MFQITVATAGSTFHKDNDYYDHTESNEYYDSSSAEEQSFNDEEKASTFTDQTETPQSQYEVTEIIYDIPNTENILGPVVTNFTLTRPLNNATNTANLNFTSAINNHSKNDKETINKLKKNHISIFHVTAEFDNDKQKTSPVQNIHIHKYPHFIGFRDYMHGLRKGIESGLNHFMHKDKYINVNVPNAMAQPVLLFNKFHNKGGDLAASVHRAIFGRQYEPDRGVGYS